jgi:hypothetical protein
LWKIWNIIKKRTQNDIEQNKKVKNKNNDELSVEVDESWEARLYQSPFWKQLTSLVEKFVHKTLTIDYIQ